MPRRRHNFSSNCLTRCLLITPAGPSRVPSAHFVICPSRILCSMHVRAIEMVNSVIAPGISEREISAKFYDGERHCLIEEASINGDSMCHSIRAP